MVVSYICWRHSVCDMPHSYVGRDNSYVTCLIHMWHASSICGTGRIHMGHDTYEDECIWDMMCPMCDMSHSCAAWRIYVWHDAFTCDMTTAYVIWLFHTWYDLFTCVNICMYIYIYTCIWIYICMCVYMCIYTHTKLSGKSNMANNSVPRRRRRVF